MRVLLGSVLSKCVVCHPGGARISLQSYLRSERDIAPDCGERSICTSQGCDLPNWCRMGRKAPPFAPTAEGRKRKGSSVPPLVACKRPAPVQASGWAFLPSDIAQNIAWRLLKNGDVVDYITFRAACSGWRACTPTPCDPNLRRRCLRPVGWVALCDGDAVRPDDAGEITFLHKQTARRIRVRLPEFRLHRIVGFTDGLVILLHKRTTAVRVLHPFTRVAVDFPPLAPVYHQVVKNRNSVLHMNAAVCSSASSTTSIAVVAWFPWTPVLLSAEAGNPTWLVIHKDIHHLLNVLPFQGRLYSSLQFSRQIVQLYPPRPFGPVVAHVPDEFGRPILCNYYLVESGGHMLLVVQHSNVDRGVEVWRNIAFAIFKVDVRRWELIPVSSLGNQALFLCKDRCLSVSAKDLPSICSNSLYFSAPLSNPMVVHSLSSRSFERPTTFCQVHDIKERIRPSVRPFTLADHLLTYGNHREWANGLMFHEYHGVPEFFEELKKKIKTYRRWNRKRTRPGAH